ncbi:AAA family ATPase [Nostoc sp. TCL26-01]|uniref:AAA family ATPase n=1 Tax=Nostoc sp. TCL26-01 TaxID=2576904 RepID=UPI0015BF1ADF|nr:AAA family ATPase [Nostoc sp. TCL26-01]QLE59808.1 AAA family ATPase [Nostoc sp. TCL26-01]
MTFNTQEVITSFHAGCATVAINSPTASEINITHQLIVDIALRLGMESYIWDIAKSLQKVEPKMRSGKVTGLPKTPAPNFDAKGHPIEALLKHIEAECANNTSVRKLFILKDIYPFITGINPNPVFVRLAIDTFNAAKRSSHRLVILHDNLRTPKVFQDLIADMHNPNPTQQETEHIFDTRVEALKKSAIAQGAELPIHISPSDKKRLIRALQGMSYEAIEDAISLCATSLRKVDVGAIEFLSKHKQKKFAAKGIRYAESPDVAVQGLPAVTEWAETMAALLEPEAQEKYNIPFPSGALWVGVGGTGKTLCVKTISQLWGLPSLIMDTGSLMSRELGASEERLREYIQAAEDLAPSILFIDEFDKLMPGGNAVESDSGTSARMFGYFLTWFEENKSSVFVAATCNRPWGIKDETKRRFTKIFYVDLPNLEARRDIWNVQLNHCKVAIKKPEMERLASVSADYTGAEIRKVVQQCASYSYAKTRKVNVSVEDLLAELHRTPAQFKANTRELEELRKWARSGGATWAAPETEAGERNRERSVTFHSTSENSHSDIIDFSDFN